MCDDLSDVSVNGVAELLPAWLELVAARVVRPGVAVRQAGHRIDAVIPAGLLITMFHSGRGTWSARLQSLPTIADLGAQGRPFSVVGVVPLPIDRGCGSAEAAASALSALLEPATAVAAVADSPNPALLSRWRALASSHPVHE